MAFEENVQDLAQNVASLGFDLVDLAARKKLLVDHVVIERTEIQETGSTTLRAVHPVGHAIDSIGRSGRARHDRVSLRGLSNEAILRSELQRLFVGSRERGHRRHHGRARRDHDHAPRPGRVCGRLRDHVGSPGHGAGLDEARTVVKYRGSRHETNEFPSSSETMDLSLPSRRWALTTMSPWRAFHRIFRLDKMLGGKGYYRGSSIWSPDARTERRASRRRSRTRPAGVGSGASS